MTGRQENCLRRVTNSTYERIGMKSLEEGFQYFKLNCDDILSIVKDHLVNKVTFEDGHSGLLNFLGSDETGDLRIVAAFVLLEETIEQVDLEEADKKIDFNGFWSTMTESDILKTRPGETKEEMIQRLNPNWWTRMKRNFKR